MAINTRKIGRIIVVAAATAVTESIKIPPALGLHQSLPRGRNEIAIQTNLRPQVRLTVSQWNNDDSIALVSASTPFFCLLWNEPGFCVEFQHLITHANARQKHDEKHIKFARQRFLARSLKAMVCAPI